MTRESPAVAAWELTLRLKARRKELGIDTKTLAAELNFSRNYWSAVENNRTLPSDDKLRELAPLFRYSDTEIAELLALREAARARGWWQDYAEILDERELELYGLEPGAVGIRTYEGMLMPGLLQCERYARRLIEDDPSVADVNVDDRVAVRLLRQEQLRDPRPLRLTALISESALLAMTGGGEIMREQLLYLANVIDELPETLEVRVVPASSGPAGLSTLHFLDFATLPTRIYQEAMTPGDFVDVGDPVRIRHLEMSFSSALDVSLSRSASHDRILEQVAVLG